MLRSENDTVLGWLDAELLTRSDLTFADAQSGSISLHCSYKTVALHAESTFVCRRNAEGEMPVKVCIASDSDSIVIESNGKQCTISAERALLFSCFWGGNFEVGNIHVVVAASVILSLEEDAGTLASCCPVETIHDGDGAIFKSSRGG